MSEIHSLVAPKTRNYIACVFGSTFVINAPNKSAVRVHMSRKLREHISREHISIELATFDDGVEAARLGIKTEVAGAESATSILNVEDGA